MSILDVAYEMHCRERMEYGPTVPGIAAPFGVPPDMPAYRWVVSRAMMQALTEAAPPQWTLDGAPIKSAFGAERRLFGWRIEVDPDAPPETLRLERGTMSDRFDGPDCGVDGCQREVGHIGDHRRVEEITPGSLDRRSFGLPQGTCRECGHDLAAHTIVTNDGCMIEECVCDASGEVRSPFEDLEAENADLRRAIAEFTDWYDTWRYATDDVALTDQVEALRSSLGA